MIFKEEIGVTHECGVVSNGGKSTCYIIDENKSKQTRYNELSDNPSLESSMDVNYFFNVSGQLVGITITVRVRSLDDKFEYVVEPSEEFISCILDTNEIHFINKSGKTMFEMRKMDISAIQRYNAQYRLHSSM